MQQTPAIARRTGTAKERVEAMIETLTADCGRSESVAEVAHDARNMVTALGLYCDLLEEPGVLANPFAHYGSELRLVAEASRQLVEKLVALDSGCDPAPNSAASRFVGRRAVRHPAEGGRSAAGRQIGTAAYWEPTAAAAIDNLAAELLANHNLMAALAGPGVTVALNAVGGARPVRMTGEDLTRILVNLVKNAAEAMPKNGSIQIELRELFAENEADGALMLTIEDNGPGIPEEALEKIFTSGYSTRSRRDEPGNGWAKLHQGLGLAIVRSIVEAAGGRIFAANRAQGGVRFEIRLPVLTITARREQ